MATAMDKTLFQMKFTSKQLERESKKMDKKKDELDKKAMDCSVKGDTEKAAIFAGEAIRNKNTSVQYTRLAARMEAVASRVESAIRMKSFAASMGHAIVGMDSVLATMDPTKIQHMMEKFEKQFEDLDVGTATLDAAVGKSTAGAMPEAEVAAYLAALNEAAAQKMGDKARGIGVGAGAVGQGSATAGQDRVAAAVAQGSDAGRKDDHPPAGGQGGAAGGGQSMAGPPQSGAAVADALAARLAALRK